MTTTRGAHRVDTTPDQDPWCDAKPFRDHIVRLMRTTGLHWRLIAALSGTSPSAMQHLLHGRDGKRPTTIHVSLARALMRIDEDDLDPAHNEKRRTTAKEPRELLTALITLGHTPTELSAWLTPQDLRLLHSPRALYCSVATHARIQACYDLLLPSTQALPAAI